MKVIVSLELQLENVSTMLHGLPKLLHVKVTTMLKCQHHNYDELTKCLSVAKATKTYSIFFPPVAKCPAPELNQDGHFTIAPRQTGFYEQGDTIVYSCEEGFVNVAASNRRTCLKDGTWSGNEAICERE